MADLWKMSAGRDIVILGSGSKTTGRCVLILLQASGQMLQTAFKLMNILPRHRRIRYGSLTLILTLDITAYNMSVDIMEYRRKPA